MMMCFMRDEKLRMDCLASAQPISTEPPKQCFYMHRVELIILRPEIHSRGRLQLFGYV
jgi:hypothetical protein